MRGYPKQKTIEGEMVFEYQEPDESVGIYGGYVFIGFQPANSEAFVDEADITKWADRRADELSESAFEDED